MKPSLQQSIKYDIGLSRSGRARIGLNLGMRSIFIFVHNRIGINIKYINQENNKTLNINSSWKH